MHTRDQRNYVLHTGKEIDIESCGWPVHSPYPKQGVAKHVD